MKIKLNKNSQKVLENAGLQVIERGKYFINENIEIETPSKIRALCGGHIELGAFSGINSSRIDDSTNVKIGRYCSIALGVRFNLGQHPIDWLSTSDFQYSEFPLGENLSKRTDNHLKHPVPFSKESERTIIGNDVWIGDGVTIKSGVKIGDGAIIGTNALVLKDVPAYAIIAGIPAKVIRYRFTPEIIEKLLQLRWWDYHYQDFKDVDFENIELAISQIEKLIKNGMQKYQGKVLTQKDFVRFQSLRRRLKSFFL